VTFAAVFPGQGAQRLGMARDFYDAHSEARRVFEQASDELAYDVAQLCFEDAERLARTEFQQPVLLTAELAILAALRADYGFDPRYFGGHSLGEYTALAAAGVLDVAGAAALVRERGKLMQEAVPLGEGSMTAVLKPDLDVERLRALLAESEGIEVDLANDNSPDQVVLSGSVVELARATQRLKEDAVFARGRCIPLRVSAPFHSRLMAPAADRFRPVLEEASRTWRIERAALVVCNVTGAFYAPDRAALVDALTRQIVSPVRWLDCMKTLLANADRVIEIGPGKVLTGFFKSMDVAIENVSDVAGADRVFQR
jgi:[acyl-carrier-protein] S-malonyltransferase/trans-AT polyketide synthase/acyltransferase/oxidoreductase domain-containing protein